MNEADGITDKRRGVVVFFNVKEDAPFAAPVRHPGNFFNGRGDETGACKFLQTSVGQSQDFCSFPRKGESVEGDGVGSPVGECRGFRVTVGIIQHADHPDVIEGSPCASCVAGLNPEGNLPAGGVEGFGLKRSKRIRRDGTIKFSRFHNQRGQFSDTGAHVQASAGPRQAGFEHGRKVQSGLLAGTFSILPERQASVVTVD